MNAISNFFANASGTELAAVGAMVVIMAAVFLVWVNLIERDHLSKRMREMASHKDSVYRRETAAQAKSSVRRQFQTVSLFNRLGSNLRRAQTEQATKTRRFLSQAGWRSTEALGIYIFICAIMPLVGVVIAFLLYNTVPALHDRPQIVKLGGLVLFAFLGFKLPEWVVGWVVKKRKEKLDRALPDALDLMVVCTEAGLGLDASFQRVSGEIGQSHPVLADELMLTSVELNILPRRQEALDNMLHRTGTTSIESVVNTLGQTERYGTPLGQSFRVLASDFREQRMLKAEAKAARLPAILTVPLVVFILPSLFAVLLGPAVIKSLDAF
ncbi:type II secretion system F family protein [Emcibacter sp. SYSU 3D8]|uniref:type II secretion system F family protein n=1 Tax=Emcibacter sp. SYSU 3D8 TaxID=3133969 RepID=UPI0031FE6A7A